MIRLLLLLPFTLPLLDVWPVVEPTEQIITELRTTSDPVTFLNHITITPPPVTIPLNMSDAVAYELSTRSKTMSKEEATRTAEVIYKLTTKLKLNPLLFIALMRVESNFNHLAISPVGAEGLMQVMPPTAKWTAKKYNVEWPDGHSFDPIVNVKLGVYYLAYLYDQFGNMRHALTAYNRGPRATRYILNNNRGRLPREIDNFYSAKIMERFQILKEKYEGIE